MAPRSRRRSGHLADMPSTGTAQDLWGISAIGCLRPQGSSPWNICAKAHYSHVKRSEFRSCPIFCSNLGIKRQGVAFSLVSFFRLNKRKKLACRARATYQLIKLNFQISNAPSDQPLTAPAHPRHKVGYPALSSSPSPR